MDARLSSGFPLHPKTKKLLRRLGPAGAWALVCLFLWARCNRSDGDLSGMTDEDIELAVDWTGDEGSFVAALVGVGFLDGDPGRRAIHDWLEHQPWSAGEGERAKRARWRALIKHHGREKAVELMPDYAASINAASTQHASSMPVAGDSMLDRAACSAPSPSPSPSPSLKELPPSEVVAGGDEKPDPVVPIDKTPHNEIIAAYHEVLPMCATVRIWDEGRRALLRSRWREDKDRQSVDWWRKFFEYVRGCPFLVGQVEQRGREPFTADLEWLIRPTNFRKVIEGRYEGRAA